MTCLAVTYTVRPGEEERAATHLRALAVASREEPGCLMYLIHQARDDQRTFVIYEQYGDDAAMNAHLASPHFAEHGLNGIRQLAESRVGHVCEPLT